MALFGTLSHGKDWRTLPIDHSLLDLDFYRIALKQKTTLVLVPCTCPQPFSAIILDSGAAYILALLPSLLFCIIFIPNLQVEIVIFLSHTSRRCFLWVHACQQLRKGAQPLQPPHSSWNPSVHWPCPQPCQPPLDWFRIFSHSTIVSILCYLKFLNMGRIKIPNIWK